MTRHIVLVASAAVIVFGLFATAVTLALDSLRDFNPDLYDH